MGKAERDRVLAAVKLRDQISGIGGGCLQLALTALGGIDLGLNEVSKYMEMREGFLNYVRRFGLVPWDIRLINGMNKDELVEYLSNPSNNIHKYDFKFGSPLGFVVAFLPIGEDQKGHAIALLTKSGLPRDARKLFKKKELFLTIDLQQKNLLNPITCDYLIEAANNNPDYLTAIFKVSKLRSKI